MFANNKELMNEIYNAALVKYHAETPDVYLNKAIIDTMLQLQDVELDFGDWSFRNRHSNDYIMDHVWEEIAKLIGEINITKTIHGQTVTIQLDPANNDAHAEIEDRFYEEFGLMQLGESIKVMQIKDYICTYEGWRDEELKTIVDDIIDHYLDVLGAGKEIDHMGNFHATHVYFDEKYHNFQNKMRELVSNHRGRDLWK